MTRQHAQDLHGSYGFVSTTFIDHRLALRIETELDTRAQGLVKLLAESWTPFGRVLVAVSGHDPCTFEKKRRPVMSRLTGRRFHF